MPEESTPSAHAGEGAPHRLGKSVAPGHPDAPVSPSTLPGIAKDAETSQEALEASVAPLIASLSYEIKHGKKDASRLARLNFELGSLLEWSKRDSKAASEHFQKALSAQRDHIPSLRGALRTLVASGKHRAALKLWDALADQASSDPGKALILLEKARFLEESLNDERGARAVYYSASSLAEDDQWVLKTLEKSELRAAHWNALERVYSTLVSSTENNGVRSARLLQYARLMEVRRGDLAAATSAYEEVVDLGGSGAGLARRSLLRLYDQQGRWSELAQALRREADTTTDQTRRSLLLYQLGRVEAERLENRAAAIEVLERAAADSEDDPLVLSYLARQLEADERFDALTPVLRRLVVQTDQASERQVLLHRIGQLVERTGDEMAAIVEYKGALQADPSFVPILRELGRLFTKHERWEELVDMHQAEAANVDDPRRQAQALSRIGLIQETRLGAAKEAVASHEKALALVPAHEQSWRALARLYMAAGDFKKLADLHELIVEHTDEDDHDLRIERLMKLGAIYDDYSYAPVQAIETYRRVLALSPQHLPALHALQRSGELGERYDVLVEALMAEVDCAPDDERMVALLSQAAEVKQRHLDDPEGARELLVRVLDIRPHHRMALEQLGRHFFRTGEWESLKATYIKELETLDPSEPEAVALMHKLGELCEQKMREPAEAMQWYLKANEIAPTFLSAAHALERRLRDERSYAQLAELLRRRRDHQSGAERATTCVQLGQLFEEHLNDDEKATEAFREASELLHGHPVTASALQRLDARAESWDRVVEQVRRTAEEFQDEDDRLAASLGLVDLYRDRLEDTTKAVELLVTLLESHPNNDSILISLESIARQSEQWDLLADVLERQLARFTEPDVVIAIRRELGTLYETKIQDLESAQQVFTQLLEAQPSDPFALAGLERIAYHNDDTELLSDVLAKYLNGAESELEKVALRTRLGEVAEPHDPKAALAFYSDALGSEHTSLTAVRGLVRVSERMDDANVLTNALRREAELSSHPAVAADCLVRAASIGDESLGGQDQAIEDLLRALDLTPTHQAAAESLSSILRRRGDYARLVEVLEDAADRAKKGDQVAELRLEAAVIRADVLDDLEEATTRLANSAKRAPHHVQSHRTLAEFYARQEAWKKAEKAWDQVLMATREDDVKRLARLTLSEILDTRLDDRLKAAMHLRTLLKSSPMDVEALERLLDLMIRGVAFKEALDVANDLVAATEGSDKQPEAYTAVGNINLALKREEDAVLAFEQAIVSLGPESEAGEIYRELLPKFGSWGLFAKATRTYLDRGEAEGAEGLAQSWLELIRIYEDELSQHSDAIVAARDACERHPHHEVLQIALGRNLRLNGNARDAVETLTSLVVKDPGSVDGWSELVLAFGASSRTSELALAAEALSLLRGEATSRPRSTATGDPGSMSVEVVERFTDDASPQATALLAALHLGLVKLNSFDAADHDVTSRDRLTNKKQGLRKTAESLLGLFNVKKLGELYLGSDTLDKVVAGMSEKPVLVAPSWLEDASFATQVYALSLPLVTIVRGLTSVEVLTHHAVEQALESLAGRGDAGLNTRLVKACPRGIRKQLPELGSAYAGVKGVDVEALQGQIRRTSRRVALLLADDLGVALKALRREKGIDAQRPLVDWITSDSDAADLVSFWCSRPAMMWRRNEGQL